MRGDEFYLQAFRWLSTTRDFGATGPIPWDRIILYGERAGLDSAMMGVFLRVIQELDAEYMKWADTEHKRKSDAAKRSRDAKAPRRG